MAASGAGSQHTSKRELLDVPAAADAASQHKQKLVQSLLTTKQDNKAKATKAASGATGDASNLGASALLARAAAFMPLMQQANASLNQQIQRGEEVVIDADTHEMQNGGGNDVEATLTRLFGVGDADGSEDDDNDESDSESEQEHIELDVALGVFDVKANHNSPSAVKALEQVARTTGVADGTLPPSCSPQKDFQV
ncbi:hypothetical protein PPROV_000129200 [Pycnococcus provasolii]|uniref:Uncharacterized protein n=1 Tax=Pycnococcus provasolii TaxID=41880 RepID=A0A830H5S0_9CHLO|nr:hypothetical protein PPROV_000129200 [Pycnococcus provasolii]|eukprot:CAMPEP_0205947700 /NCGR_PEP_ID=MMETSP1459-20131121/153_1 /ASSEMBLY_ACC=CAM_ASM_001120 /TAXON_ID=41880 /ORGANISM="Pycnococcus provasolii, Strain RCC931" /LENGTH=195 /DNA_ID=CAMNT_0053318833 /DNA_START=16 /DNA_END=603 /DNA_ORIENTATION=-